MPEIAFHFNAPDRLGYACRLLRKAVRTEARVTVVAAPDTLGVLDALLWDMDPSDFVAHAGPDASQEVRQYSPIVLVTALHDAPHHDVLLQLDAHVPEGYERFGRVLEVVSAHDAPDRESARQRWRHYAARGDTIVRHDVVQKSTA